MPNRSVPMNLARRHRRRWIAAVPVLPASWLVLRMARGPLNFATGMLFLATFWALVAFVVDGAIRRCRVSGLTRSKVLLLVVTLAILSVAVEVFLRFGVGTYATYLERNGSGEYQSFYQQLTGSWFHVLPENQEVRMAQREFTYTRRTNSLGLAEREVSRSKESGAYRVIALGDSFTEGTGAPSDSTWVRAFTRTLGAAFPGMRLSTINAGIGGSDVFFEYMLLRERLLPFDPDLVIVAINFSDVQEVVVRGGMERFREDGTSRYALSPPWWERFYAVSFTLRHVVHDLLGYNWLLLGRRELATRTRRAVEQINRALDAFQDLADLHGFQLLVVTHPVEREILRGEYVDGFADVSSYLEQNDDIWSVDLLRDYQRAGTITAANADQFFWPLDTHHNSWGYQIMGEAIARTVLEPQAANRPVSRLSASATVTDRRQESAR